MTVLRYWHRALARAELSLERRGLIAPIRTTR